MTPSLYGQQEGRGFSGGTSRGISGWVWGLEGWMACTEVWGMPAEGCPIFAETGTFPGFCWGLGLGPEYGWTWPPWWSLEWLLTSLCTMLNCSGSKGWPVVVLCKWMGRELWDVPWPFLPGIYLTLLCRHWGSLFGDTCNVKWCLFDCFWGPYPWGCLIMFWGCWFLCSVLVFLCFCKVSWTFHLSWACRGLLW